jgi:nickel-dependent lactate racemase
VSDETDSSHEQRGVHVPYAAWYEETKLSLDFPKGWHAVRLDPDGAPAIGRDEIERAFREPLGTPPLRELARGRRSAVVVVDDLTRPTPVSLFLRDLLDELEAGGIPSSDIRILFGTAAHRPPDDAEQAKKLGPDVAGRFPVLVHDFMGPDVRKIGWVDGGPVHLNRHFLDAELRVCVGGVIPHNETGYGGGAKMVVPGVAGHLTIAHFHGALPPRTAGQLEAEPGRFDRRAWSEAVAREVGLHAVVCANVNARRELAGLFIGDPVAAHRRAAERARLLGRTPVPRALADEAEVVVVNAYPLDTDPIQMGKSLNLARKLAARTTVVVNAASDGIFYHGMGMGSGLQSRRLLANLPGWLASPARVGTWMRSALRAARHPELTARLGYFHLNPLPYAAFQAGDGRLAKTSRTAKPVSEPAEPLVFSRRFPDWGLRRKYPRGRLFREWHELEEVLASRFPRATALVFPCAPLQLPEITQTVPPHLEKP